MVNAAARKAAARGACVITVTHRVKSALDADHVRWTHDLYSACVELMMMMMMMTMMMMMMMMMMM